MLLKQGPGVLPRAFYFGVIDAEMHGLTCKDIEKACKELHEKYGRSDLLYKTTLKGFWATSIIQDVYEAFEWVGLQNYSHFIDLGSGDGRVVAVASLFTKATGVEIDPDLYELSTRLKKSLSINNIEFYLGDFEELDFSNFDFIYIYPDQPRIRIEQTIKSTWCGSIMVAGLHFEPINWKLIVEEKFSTEKFNVYRTSL